MASGFILAGLVLLLTTNVDRCLETKRDRTSSSAIDESIRSFT